MPGHNPRASRKAKTVRIVDPEWRCTRAPSRGSGTDGKPTPAVFHSVLARGEVARLERASKPAGAPFACIACRDA